MAINVTCPGCHTRFKVNDKFGGKKGPCPKCKQIIQVPSADEKVVIHAPEHSEVGARGAKGQLVLKPITREKARFHPVMAVVVGGLFLTVLVVAVSLRGADEMQGPFLVLGAILLAPPLAMGGYSFLRNDELEPHRGLALVVRTLICSAVYAAIWAAYSWFCYRFFGGSPLEIWQVLFAGLIFLPLGGITALACYDLDFGNGVVHYSFYLLVTVILRLAMGLTPI
ncbi:MAG: hypothetical protein BMS9Abin04_172 [Planctomycetia bacterium]|nr:MAG: hypothetical protein BMS9Abin04_172 [Planctomycetia bacterium]